MRTDFRIDSKNDSDKKNPGEKSLSKFNKTSITIDTKVNINTQVTPCLNDIFLKPLIS